MKTTYINWWRLERALQGGAEAKRCFPHLVLLYFISLFGPVSGGGATGLERRRLYQLISPVCVRFNNICVTQEARWAWTTPRCASASSGGLSWTTRCSRTLHCRAAHYVRVLVLTNILVQWHSMDRVRAVLLLRCDMMIILHL